MAAWVRANGVLRVPDMAQSIAAGVARDEAPFGAAPGTPSRVREALFDCMWDDVGILRDAERPPRRASRASATLDDELDAHGVAGRRPRLQPRAGTTGSTSQSLIAVSARHRDRGARARGLARRALSRGFSGGGRPRRRRRITVVRQRGAASSRSRTSRCSSRASRPASRCSRRRTESPRSAARGGRRRLPQAAGNYPRRLRRLSPQAAAGYPHKLRRIRFSAPISSTTWIACTTRLVGSR